MKEILIQLSELWGKGAAYEIEHNEHVPYEAHYLKLDSSMANHFLNWFPQWQLDTALLKTVEWYQAYQNEENLYDFTQQQIIEYSK